ncbi:FAD-dependent oxidoreductase [Caballeronia sp. LZ032]|uniref:NAD(P)/FAD-dependent oxidoreductase n=1 Tax=Caballeronia sp. LZ032 TaxID=3038565 RepID=UPI00285F26E8|nr:FAD-dependent oxidoreductase [Caballeronia sp. LZ032]MDR5882081.1 FAD-dependent oxidoreductase [Caballeronia sp. LZ032]
MTHPARIVIVGGGIAGILLATKLGREIRNGLAATVTLVDMSATHIWKPMLHTIAAGTRDVNLQQVSFIAHAAAHGYAYQPGAMCGLDRERKQVQVAEIRAANGEKVLDARTIDYDVLVLALGSRANDFGTQGVAQHAHFIDSQAQAEAFNEILRARLFRSIARDQRFRVAIVGGGATGVELAAELSSLLDIASGYGDPTVRQRLELTLIESSPRILASFPPNISASSETLLTRMGFSVLTQTRVTGATADGFLHGSGDLVPADLMVWAAGVKAPEFLAGLAGLETTHSNQLVTRATLQASRDDQIFALGDCSSLTLRNAERALPPTAQVATQQAEHLAKTLPAWLTGAPLRDFAYHDFGSLVSLANYDAFGTLGKFGFFKGGFIKGRLAQLSHAMLYRRHQQAIHGVGKATLLLAADGLNRLTQPPIRLA